MKHKANQIPTLSEIRQHIVRNGWNGPVFRAKDSNREVFDGMCHYASTAVSEMMSGNWKMVVRGWFVDGETKHEHSWVTLPDGTIVDPTFWQFTNDPAKVFVFPANDPRFIPEVE